MIDFTIPPHILENIEKYRTIAVEVMRPVARELDEGEHERPQDYFNAMWPIVKEQYSDRITAIKNGTDNATPDGPNWALLENILMIEQLSWGDAGQYLCRPTPSLGGAAIDAVGTNFFRVRLFTEGEFLRQFLDGFFLNNLLVGFNRKHNVLLLER